MVSEQKQAVAPLIENMKHEVIDTRCVDVYLATYLSKCSNRISMLMCTTVLPCACVHASNVIACACTNRVCMCVRV